MREDRSQASTSLSRHLLRGAVGFGTLVGSLALMPVFGPVALVLAPVGLVALRGCPACWAIKLMETISLGRVQRSCVDGRCELTVPGRPPVTTREGDPSLPPS
ncbi:hypothetical protein [Embleya sp. NBC_00896]|uniref:hypothetical protein n=1 Tax=Embleya sp. NBC_00896 TaxID=2975961 RepID=UPI002F912712|nr:hypothetical protein OG928_40320 [Embleya sp. NBC_00896]